MPEHLTGELLQLGITICFHLTITSMLFLPQRRHGGRRNNPTATTAATSTAVSPAKPPSPLVDGESASTLLDFGFAPGSLKTLVKSTRRTKEQKQWDPSSYDKHRVCSAAETGVFNVKKDRKTKHVFGQRGQEHPQEQPTNNDLRRMRRSSTTEVKPFWTEPKEFLSAPSITPSTFYPTHDIPTMITVVHDSNDCENTGGKNDKNDGIVSELSFNDDFYQASVGIGCDFSQVFACPLTPEKAKADREEEGNDLELEVSPFPVLSKKLSSCRTFVTATTVQHDLTWGITASTLEDGCNADDVDIGEVGDYAYQHDHCGAGCMLPNLTTDCAFWPSDEETTAATNEETFMNDYTHPTIIENNKTLEKYGLLQTTASPYVTLDRTELSHSGTERSVTSGEGSMADQRSSPSRNNARECGVATRDDPILHQQLAVDEVDKPPTPIPSSMLRMSVAKDPGIRQSALQPHYNSQFHTA